MDRLNELYELIHTYRFEYYVTNRSFISDDEYDALKQEMLAIEKEHPDWVSDSSPSKVFIIEPLAIYYTPVEELQCPHCRQSKKTNVACFEHNTPYIRLRKKIFGKRTTLNFNL